MFVVPRACAFVLFLLVGILAASVARAAEFSLLDLYREEIARLVDAPGTSRSVAAGRINPASWPVHGRGGFSLAFEDYGSDRTIDDVTGSLSLGAVGLGVRHVDTGPFDWTEYTFGVGFGNKSATMGIAYAWSKDRKSVV